MNMMSYQSAEYHAPHPEKVAKNMSLVSVAIVALAISILVSAFAVVYIKDLSRRLFITYQTLQHQQQIQQTEQGKLLLEQTTLSSQTRIQRFASNQLGMVVPDNHQVIMIAAKASSPRVLAMNNAEFNDD